MGFANTCRAKKHKCANWAVGIFQPDAISLNGFYNLVDCLILSNDAAFQFVAHVQQPRALGLCDSLHWHAGHHCHDLCNFVFVHNFSVVSKVGFPFFFFVVKFGLKVTHRVAKACCLLKVLRLCGFELELVCGSNLFLDFLNLFWSVHIAYMHS